jgi:serine/threonine protein kinase
MVATELGACEWFVWDLRRSNLLDRGQLDQIVGEFLQRNPRAEPTALAEFLVDKQIITQFQAERLLQGKTQGFVLGPFTLMDALGSGSMGTVYKAQSKTDNHWYAVKVLPRRSMWNVRIARRKVRSFEACKHPAVVPFVDVGTAGGMHYLAWPYVEGEILGKIIEQHGKVEPSFAVHYALQIAEALDVCHQQGLFHGLLKPANIMVGADSQVHILDFGIGSLLAETEGESLVDTMSTSNSVTSGLDFAAPESIMDPQNLTPLGDQYSLGCILYYIVTGQLPFPDGSVAEKMLAHQTKDPTPVRDLNPDVPADLVAIIERLMKKSPEQRYATSKELVEILQPLAGEIGSSPATEARPRQPASPANSPHSVSDRLKSARGDVVSQLRHGTPGPVSVSNSTPKPRDIGILPSRASFRKSEKTTTPGRTAAALEEPAAAPPEDVDATPESAVTPQAPVQSEFLERGDRLGTLGLTVSALAACILVFFIARMMNIF